MPHRLVGSSRWKRSSFALVACVMATTLLYAFTFFSSSLLSISWNSNIMKSIASSTTKLRPAKAHHKYSCAGVPLPDPEQLDLWTEAHQQTKGLGTATHLILPSKGLAARHDDLNSNHTLTYTLAPEEPFCVRFAVVPNEDMSFAYNYNPLPGTMWDSLRLRISNGHVNIPVAVVPVYAPVMGRRKDVHIYEAELKIIDKGTWKLVTALEEYTDAKWNFDAEGTIVDYAPRKIDVPENFEISVVGDHPQQLEAHGMLPLCAGDVAGDVPGRFVPANILNTTLVDTLPAQDDKGLVWLPYTCRLRRYSYSELHTCLAERYPVIHMYGDSNLRRMLKLLGTDGRWCSKSAFEMESHTCKCEDYHEDLPFLQPERRFNLIKWGNVTIHYFKWEGLTQIQQVSDLIPKNNIAAGNVPDLLLLSLVNWDAAFNEYNKYLAHLEQDLLPAIELSYLQYKPDLPVMLRSGQYFCCHVDETPTSRRFSTQRVKKFNSLTFETMRNRWGATHWNVEMLSEGRAHITADELVCPSNHAPIPIVALENQVFANMLCN